MKKLHSILGTLAVTATCLSPLSLTANECGRNKDYKGCAYEETCCAPKVSPFVAVGTVAIIAAAAVLISDNDGSSSHFH